MGLSGRLAGPVLIGLAAACLIAQVLVRPAVGIANNNDFAKMAEAVGLGPADGSWLSHIQYGEFLYRYIRADRYAYNRGFRTARFLSSEFFLAKLARALQRIFHPGPRFDIRWLGAVSGAFYLLAIAIWIYAIPARFRLLLGLLLILIWTDVAYVQYLNSFYMDSAAMIFLFLSAGAGLHVVQGGKNPVFPLIMASGAILFAVSKSQHALPALLFIPLFLAFALRAGMGRMQRFCWVLSAVILIIGSCVVVGRNTDQYRRAPVFDVVFLRLAAVAPDPLSTLQELGLSKNELGLVHTHAYFPQSPLANEAWARQFSARCNYGTLLRYYVRHPFISIRLLYQELFGEASRIHPFPFANLSLEDGFKPFSQSAHFAYWTGLRSFLLKHAPWHIILFFAGSMIGSIWILLRSPRDRRFAELLLTIEALAGLEYAMGVLGDAAETDRHLFIFHVATEIVILLVPSSLAFAGRRWFRQSYESPERSTPT